MLLTQCFVLVLVFTMQYACPLLSRGYNLLLHVSKSIQLQFIVIFVVAQTFVCAPIKTVFVFNI